ncbi:TBC1 domain family member 12 [Bombina bombina]|uniref:TBC1 domain family member 12 n=1 Tax=Bombina bombina TaxID=8345 RepID=UPI00235AE8C1|nr:TBC1 domain family member 12 [Bombina bombina]
MVGPEDAGGQGTPSFYRCGEDSDCVTEGGEEAEEGDGDAGVDLLHIYITSPAMRLTNGDLGFLPQAGDSVHSPIPNGGLVVSADPVTERCSCQRECCGLGDEPLPAEASPGQSDFLRADKQDSLRTSPDPPGHLLSPSSNPDSLQSPPSQPDPLRTPASTSPASSSSSSPVSAHTVSGYFVSGDSDRFRFPSSRNTFEVSRRQSAPDHLADGLSLPDGSPEPSEQDGDRPWRITDFITRNFFSKRSKELKTPSLSAPGWKLFGKVPPRENVQKDSKIIQQDDSSGSLSSVSTPNLLNTGEYEARTGRTCKASAQSSRRKKFEFEPLSTTALILEDRPANLPAKSVHETLRHRQEYDEMVAEAKKREVKEAQRKKKLMKERFKQEENIANAMVVWNNEILPNWDAMRNTRKVRDLWWQGLPPSVRGKVWSLAIGNELNITPELYDIFLSRAKERWKSFSETSCENDTEDAGVSVSDREASLELIKLDISRTFPSLYIFQKGGPYHDLLHSVLGAYTCYRPDVGYVQGMSFIAAVLILNLEEADAFIAFANLLNKPCQLAFFRVDHSMMLKYFAAFEIFFEENLPKLFLHFNSYSLTPDIYLIDWIFTLYSKSLPLDFACRVWDVFCRDGEEFLFRTALGILRLYEDILLQMDFIHIAQFLTKLPEDITSEKLFSCIAAIQMQNSTKKWTQVFTSLMKDCKEGEKNSPASKT